MVEPLVRLRHGSRLKAGMTVVWVAPSVRPTPAVMVALGATIHEFVYDHLVFSS